MLQLAPAEEGSKYKGQQCRKDSPEETMNCALLLFGYTDAEVDDKIKRAKEATLFDMIHLPREDLPWAPSAPKRQAGS